MRRILLFLLLVLSTAFCSATTYTKNITITKGKTIALDPKIDVTFSGSYRGSTSDNPGYTLSNTNCISVTPKYEKVNLPLESSYYTHLSLSVVAANRGTCTLTTEFWTWNTKTSTYGCHTIVYNITVVDVTSISIPSNLSLKRGTTYTFSPTVSDSNAETTLSWSSSNTSIVSVTNSGVITAKAAGSANVTCKASNGVSATCYVNVTPITVTKITISQTSGKLEVGNTLQLSTTITPSNADNRRVNWESSNPSVAIVSTAGLVTGVSEGYSIISASTTDGTNLKVSCTVNVIPPKIPINSITFEQLRYSIKCGEEMTLAPIISPSNATCTDLLWASSNETCATIDENGKISAISIGETTITATTTDGTNLSGSCTVNVTGQDISDYQNIIYFDNVSSLPGSITRLPLNLENEDEISAIQFDFYLPEGVSAVKNKLFDEYDVYFDAYSNRANSSTHVLEINEQSNGSYRLICYSSNSESFTGNKGNVLYIPIEISDEIRTGTYNVILQNIVLTEPNGTKHQANNITSELRIINHVIGDTNGDNEIDVADIVSIANYILGKDVNGFIENLADINEDSSIDVADIVAIARIILYGTSSNTRQKIQKKITDSTSSLFIEDFEMEAGEKGKIVKANLTNPTTSFTAFQFDLVLPQNISIDMNNRGTAFNIAFNKDADRTDASYHTLSSARQDDGSIRILCYSNNVESFLGNEGAILDIPLSAAENAESGDYSFSMRNIILTQVDGVKVTLSELVGNIKIKEKPSLRGDVNGDGKVDILDITELVEIVTGKKF